MVKREEPSCWLCGREIEAWRRWPDPLSFSLDHVIPCSTPEGKRLELERTNAHAAHLVCNQRRGNRARVVDPSIYVSVERF